MNQDSWVASDYAKYSSAQYQWALEMIDKMSLKEHESLLDIGCGDGKITALLSQKCAHAVGVDASLNMIRLAQKTFPAQNYPNLRFIQMDASCLNFQNQFDRVFSNSVLHWIKNHVLVLSGIYHALKPGGKCYLKFGGKGTLDAFQPMINQLLSQDQWRGYFQDFEANWYFFDDSHTNSQSIKN